MLCEVKIKILTRWLGSNASLDKIRRFKRIDRKIAVDIPKWIWACREVAPKDIYVEAIRFPRTLEFSSIAIYVDKKRNNAMSESIESGTTLTFDVFLTSSYPPGETDSRRLPTVEDFAKIFADVGDKLGLSPTGESRGFGRFRVLSVAEK